ncbi:MAG: glycosyltransferase family 2 protein [Roseateles sp.]
MENQASSRHQPPATAVVLLNWNGWRDTLACLESLAALEGDDFYVIVVDNASTDGSWEALKAGADKLGGAGLDPRWQVLSRAASEGGDIPAAGRRSVWLIQAGENGGFAKGNNVGLRVALRHGVQFAWVLNNDTLVRPDSLRELVARAEQDPKLGMVGSILLYASHPNVIQAFGGATYFYGKARGTQIGSGQDITMADFKALGRERLDYVAGASMLVRAELMRSVGLFAEHYFLYFEEIDWAQRARHDWRLGTADKSIVWHKEGASIGTATLTKRSLLSEYYLARNLILFYGGHLPWLLGVAVLRNLREALGMCLRREDSKRIATVLRATWHGVIRKTGATH